MENLRLLNNITKILLSFPQAFSGNLSKRNRFRVETSRNDSLWKVMHKLLIILAKGRRQMMQKTLLLIVFVFIIPIIIVGQGRPYEGPEDPAGDISEEREGYMNGNRVVLYFKNGGQIADIFKFGYNNPKDSKWPNNFSGTRMIDVGSIEVFSKVFVKNDSIPVTDLNEIESLRSNGEIDSLMFVQIGWKWKNDKNYEETILWDFMPVKGYLNPAQDYIAMSNKPDSWPIEGWTRSRSSDTMAFSTSSSATRMACS